MTSKRERDTPYKQFMNSAGVRESKLTGAREGIFTPSVYQSGDGDLRVDQAQIYGLSFEECGRVL